VTPFPTQSPPVIPEIVGKPEQPFWIYYWQENEIWRVDDQGETRELLLDTYQELERWLTGYPHPGTDAVRDSRRVSVSPDGQKLALVVLDKINLSGREPYTYSLYVFDVAAGSLQFISDGGMPVWAPDSQRLAFVPGTVAADGFDWDQACGLRTSRRARSTRSFRPTRTIDFLRSAT
jgi:Tol biopolymer transport system component